jgi:hypothetical protein
MLGVQSLRNETSISSCGGKLTNGREYGEPGVDPVAKVSCRVARYLKKIPL